MEVVLKQMDEEDDELQAKINLIHNLIQNNIMQNKARTNLPVKIGWLQMQSG